MGRNEIAGRKVEDGGVQGQDIIACSRLGVNHSLDAGESSVQDGLCFQRACNHSVSRRPIKRRVTARYNHNYVRYTLKHGRYASVAGSA